MRETVRRPRADTLPRGVIAPAAPESGGAARGDAPNRADVEVEDAVRAADAATVRVLVRDAIRHRAILGATIVARGRGGVASAPVRSRGVPVRLTVVADDRVEVLAECPGFESASVTMERGASAEFAGEVSLQPKQVRIPCRLVDRQGVLLAADRLRALYPQIDATSRFSWTCGICDIVARESDGRGGHRRIRFADSSEIGAEFGLWVPADFDGDVAAIFCDRVLASRPWKAGDGVVDLAVDVDDALSGLGVVEISVRDKDGAPIENAVVRLSRDAFWPGAAEIERFAGAADPKAQPGVYRDSGIGPSRWRLTVAAPGFGAVARDLDVAVGATARADVRLGPAATIEVIVVSVVPPADEIGAPVAFDGEGRSLSGTVDAAPMPHESRFRVPYRFAAAAGTIGFAIAGSTRRLTLVPGDNPTIEWQLSRPARTRFRIHREAPRPGTIAGQTACEVRLFSEDGIEVARAVLARDDAGPDGIDEWTPPPLATGPYRFELREMGRTPISTRVLVPVVEESVVDVDLTTAR